MKSELGLALSRVLLEHEPKLLQCDLDASARAAAEVSNLLGCIMATVLIKMNSDDYETAFNTVMLNVRKSAQEAADKAANITPNLTSH